MKKSDNKFKNFLIALGITSIIAALICWVIAFFIWVINPLVSALFVIAGFLGWGFSALFFYAASLYEKIQI